MKIFLNSLVLVVFVSCLVQVQGDTVTCYRKKSPCFLNYLQCPKECPSQQPTDPNAKACYLNCNSPICQPGCRSRKPNCNGRGAACHDPRFIGGDGIVFYFHGKSNQHFALVSEPNLQINARFIGLRPAGRSRDFTWIQAIGILFNTHNFSVEATRASKWDPQIDQLKFSYNGQQLTIPDSYPSMWQTSPKNNEIKVERTSAKNSALITLPEIAEISINVVPVTAEDDRIHKYNIPSDDCFAHLEVQFRFHGLSEKVEGVLGRTYQPDFVNPAKPGVAMPILGGEDRYKTSSLLDADCAVCVFSPDLFEEKDGLFEAVMSSVDCASGASSGYGMVCRK